MSSAEQVENAHRLRQLHHVAAPLLLANAWDVASARLLEEMGFPAVATSSAAIANSLGYPDGQRISKAGMLAVVGRIARAIRIPLTADMEAGYGRTAAELHRTTLDLVDTGAVGLNLEDSEADKNRLVLIEDHAEKIAVVRAASIAAGVPLVINARTDAFFLHGQPAFDPLEEAIHRARAYRAAGADCIFAPGLRDLSAIARLLEASPGPLNILGGPGAPTVPELTQVGVRRISLGSGPYRAALGLLRHIAGGFRSQGEYSLIANYALPAAEVNPWLEKSNEPLSR